MAIEWTQEDIDKLKAAIAKGVRVVRYGDRTVEYHSLKEMRDLLSSMSASVDAASGSGRRVLMETTKGF